MPAHWVTARPQQWIDERFFSIVTDLVGSPTELTDDHGNVAWHHRTTLWGNPAGPAPGAGYTPLRFPGQYADPETGLHYNYFRHYDPDTGRYASTDPLGLDGGLAVHSYVPNAHTWVDPLGLAACHPKDFVRAKENHANFDNLSEARRAAIQYSGLGPDRIAHVQKLGPWKGFVSGEMSPDGKRGWRIDWDKNKGVHVNWWDHTEGRKRVDWWYGANQVPGASYDEYEKIIDELN